ncbi:YjaG family protein [Vibrio sp. RC27]
MLRNPIQIRLEKLEPWQQITFMACLCERMYPNYVLFCQQTHYAEARIYRNILDAVWEILTVKTAKINFEKQLEKLETLIPSPEETDIFLVYPAIDSCEALSTLLHSLLDRDLLIESVQKVSQISARTVAQVEEAREGIEISDNNQKDNEAVCEEWDIQWAIYRPLKDAEVRDVDLMKDLRDELKDTAASNIGIEL